MEANYVMIIVDEDTEEYYSADQLTGLFNIAEEKGMVFTLQGYSKRILGNTADNKLACVVTEMMKTEDLKMLGLMHFDMTCHLQKLHKDVREVNKWDMGDGKVIYADKEDNTVSPFSRINVMPVKIGEEFKLLKTLSIEEFLEEAHIVS